MAALKISNVSICFHIEIVQADEPARNKKLSFVPPKEVAFYAGQHIGALAVLASVAELPLNATIVLGKRTTIIRSEVI